MLIKNFYQKYAAKKNIKNVYQNWFNPILKQIDFEPRLMFKTIQCKTKVYYKETFSVTKLK